MPHCTLRLVIVHVSCYSTSHENEGFHRKFLSFTREYLCLTMHGPPRVNEVTLELYRIHDKKLVLTKFSSVDHYKLLYLFVVRKFCVINFHRTDKKFFTPIFPKLATVDALFNIWQTNADKIRKH